MEIHENAMGRRTKDAEFRHAGHGWWIRYDGTAFVLPDFKGVRYLSHLVMRPGSELHVADLIAAAEGDADGATRRCAVFGHAGDVLDARARTEYRARLEDLERELEEAIANADLGRMERLRAEAEFVRSELCAAYGLAGRARRSSDVAERARKAVGNRIRAALAKIAEQAPALAEHLTASVRTGTFCAYEPRITVRWIG